MAKLYDENFSKSLMSFGKSFSRLNGQPLDDSSIYFSYEEAATYAASASAYVGQPIAVIDKENNTAKLYLIENAAGGLQEIGANVEFEDTNTTYSLTLTRQEETSETYGGTFVTFISSDEKEENIQFFIPDAYDDSEIFEKFDELETKISNKVDRIDVYTKTEADTKIGEAIAAADHLKRKIVDAPGTGETIDDVIDVNAADADQYIYMVPTGLQESDNKYREYIVIVDDDNRYIEQVGNWEVDLSGYLTVASAEETYAKKNDVETTYAKKTDIPTDYVSDSEFATEIAKYETAEVAAGKYVAQEEGKTLITTSELERLAQVNENAEENYINSVDETRFAVTDGRLELKELTDYAKTSDVYTKSEIDTKIGIPGAPEERDEDGNVIKEAIPGTGIYQNIYSKDEVTDLIADITGGETAADVKAELTAYKTSNDAAVNDLTTRVNEVETKATSLETLLNEKADKETVEDLASILGDIDTRVSSVETELNNYVTISGFNAAINDINNRLTWKTLSE